MTAHNDNEPVGQLDTVTEALGFVLTASGPDVIAFCAEHFSDEPVLSHRVRAFRAAIRCAMEIYGVSMPTAVVRLGQVPLPKVLASLDTRRGFTVLVALLGTSEADSPTRIPSHRLLTGAASPSEESVH